MIKRNLLWLLFAILALFDLWLLYSYDCVGDRTEAFEDIMWSLLNSSEFLSKR